MGDAVSKSCSGERNLRRFEPRRIGSFGVPPGGTFSLSELMFSLSLIIRLVEQESRSSSKSRDVALRFNWGGVLRVAISFEGDVGCPPSSRPLGEAWSVLGEDIMRGPM